MGMVEIETLRPLWFGGAVKPAGTVVAVPHADAVYLASIGRAAIIEAVPVVAEQPSDDLIGESKPVPAKGKRGG